MFEGSSIGRIFRASTWGESHGKGVGVVVDGCPPGLPLAEKDVQRDLDRRKPGQSRLTTQRKESDKVEILSGVFNGLTTGAPISMLIRNSDAKSSHYEEIRDVYRPGHADFTYDAKYGIRDWRGSGRSSGRETAGRVAAGAVAKLVLEREGMRVRGYTVRIGDVRAKRRDLSFIEKNPARAADPDAAPLMAERIEEAKAAGDSVGGVVEILVRGAPPGLGEPVFGKLDGMLAGALMGIGAVKGVEVGEGFGAAALRGSQMNDPFVLRPGDEIGTRTNRCGGVLGGISTGGEIVLRIAVKPTPSINAPQKTVDRQGRPREIRIGGRHDPCICPRIVPVAEAMVALVLADAILLQDARPPVVRI